MNRHYLFVGIILSLLLWGCSDRQQEFSLNIPIKDRGAHPKLLKMFGYQTPSGQGGENPFVTPVVVERSGAVEINSAIVKGALCQLGNRSFRAVVVDYNQNAVFDEDDAFLLAGVDEDSVLLSLNPLKVIGKNPIYFSYQDEVIKVTINEGPGSISVSRTPDFDYADLVYPYQIPKIPVTELTTNEVTTLDQLTEPNTPFLVIRSTPACKPCLQSFRRYIDRIETESAPTQSMTKVFFFPETTDSTNIIKYTSLVKPAYHFKFVKGNLADLEETYGLVVLPDGVLFDENGRFSKNHMTLSQF